MPHSQRPHCIFLLLDEYREQAMAHADDRNVLVGKYGLAGGSRRSRFERAYYNCPVCPPSRGNVFLRRNAHCGPAAGLLTTRKQPSPASRRNCAAHEDKLININPHNYRVLPRSDDRLVSAGDAPD